MLELLQAVFIQMVTHLVRKIVLEDQGYYVDSIVAGYEEFGKIGNALLEPTKIYAKPVLANS